MFVAGYGIHEIPVGLDYGKMQALFIEKASHNADEFPGGRSAYIVPTENPFIICNIWPEGLSDDEFNGALSRLQTDMTACRSVEDARLAAEFAANLVGGTVIEIHQENQ